MAESDMQHRVEELVADIPPGRVMSYGAIAAWCGHPGAARQVGAIAHNGQPGLPWHRVVRSGGRLAHTDSLNPTWQSDALAAESVDVREGRILDYETIQWYPTDNATEADPCATT